MATTRTASERIYLNADKTVVVADGDPEARFLLAGAGDEISSEYDDVKIPAKFLGGGDEKAATKAEDKAAAKAANK